MTEKLQADTYVDGRYRVLYRVGSGGMADVYCAEDQQLGRKVALKVLYRRFAEDEEFVERFRREASSAAGLQHPNVVSVYDRGSFDGTYYIAMEYLEGRSLKQVIQEESPMDPARAIDFTIQILRAARFAHKRGIIHRDLKPQNVIVDTDGDPAHPRAKVTDFGIARAGASDMTQTGSIMGTAQYLSPEQAQGLPVGPQSDLYSVGIILYELLTGRVPFEGESAVAIALKQVNEVPVPPTYFNAAVTPELEHVDLTALEKDPNARYQDADQFIAALEQARANLTAAYSQSYVAVAPDDQGYPPEPPVEEQQSPWYKKWWVWLIAALVVGGIVAAVVLAGGGAKQVAVPKVTGLTEAAAVRALEAKGFSTDSAPKTSSKPIGQVVSQDPAAGTKADEGATVTVGVSSGPAEVAVPDVSGQSQADATAALQQAKFTVKSTTRTSDTVASGTVIRTNPKAGTKAAVGSSVTLVVSSGQKTATVPNVVGQNVDTAIQLLKDSGFIATTSTVESTEPVGNVVSQDPAQGKTAPAGSTVALSVAKAPADVAIPDVVGDTQGDATRALKGAGFKVTVVEEDVDTTSQDGMVISQDPTGSAKKGATVTIFVGKSGAPPPTTPTTTPTTPTTPDNTGGANAP